MEKLEKLVREYVRKHPFSCPKDAVIVLYGANESITDDASKVVSIDIFPCDHVIADGPPMLFAGQVAWGVLGDFPHILEAELDRQIQAALIKFTVYKARFSDVIRIVGDREIPADRHDGEIAEAMKSCIEIPTFDEDLISEEYVYVSSPFWADADEAKFDDRAWAIQAAGGRQKIEETLKRMYQKYESQYYINPKSSVCTPDTLEIKRLEGGEKLTGYHSVFPTLEEAKKAKHTAILQELDDWFKYGDKGETALWHIAPDGTVYEPPEWIRGYGYIPYDPYPEWGDQKYWHIRKGEEK